MLLRFWHAYAVPSWLSGVVAISLQPKLRAYNDVCARVLGQWANLEAQADQMALDRWEQLKSDATHASIDHDTLAVVAGDAVEEFYDTAFSVRQAMTNLLTAGLFHLFEQHLFILARASWIFYEFDWSNAPSAAA